MAMLKCAVNSIGTLIHTWIQRQRYSGKSPGGIHPRTIYHIPYIPSTSSRMRGLSCQRDKTYFCLFLHRPTGCLLFVSLIILYLCPCISSFLSPCLCECLQFNVGFSHFVTGQNFSACNLPFFAICIAFNCRHFMLDKWLPARLINISNGCNISIMLHSLQPA